MLLDGPDLEILFSKKKKEENPRVKNIISILVHPPFFESNRQGDELTECSDSVVTRDDHHVFREQVIGPHLLKTRTAEYECTFVNPEHNRFRLIERIRVDVQVKAILGPDDLVRWVYLLLRAVVFSRFRRVLNVAPRSNWYRVLRVSQS